MVLTSEVSHATLSSGFTPSSQTTGTPPASISQSGVAVRSLTIVLASIRASTRISVADSSAIRERSKQSIERWPRAIVRR